MVIDIIDDSKIGVEVIEMNNPKIRYASRGIVFDESGKIAVFHKANKNEYKLPGGGVEENEDKKEAFKREVLEEVGCEVEILEELGTIEEHKSQTNFKQISSVFVAKVTKNTHELHLTEKEKAEGSELLWLEINDAKKYIEDSFDKLKSSPFDPTINGYESVYMTKFIIKRDARIIDYYLNKK